MTNDNNSYQKTMKEVGPYLGLGTQLAATVVVMLYLGKYLDGYFNIYPVLTIIFALFGGFAGVYNFIITVLNLNKKSKDVKK